MTETQRVIIEAIKLEYRPKNISAYMVDNIRFIKHTWAISLTE